MSLLKDKRKEEQRNITFTAFVRDATSEEELTRFLKGATLGNFHVGRGNIDAAIAWLLKAERSPQRLLVDISGSEGPLDELDRLADACEPSVQVYVVGDRNDVGLYRSLLRVSHEPHRNATTLAATFTPSNEGYWLPNNIEQPGGPYKVPTRYDRNHLMLYYLTNPGMCNDSLKSQFLTDDIDELKDSIEKMYAEGGTAVPAGLLWGWRMLHPAWSGHWGGPTVELEDGGSATMPRPPHRDLTRVLILLTDGANSVAGGITTDEGFRYSVTYRDSSGQWRTLNNRTIGYDQRVTNHLINNHNSLNDTDRNLTPTGRDSTADLDAYTELLCHNIKNPDDAHIPGGIKIYTVALGPASDAGLMKNCASSNGFYNAQNVNNLTQAFASIAGDLMELRLTK